MSTPRRAPGRHSPQSGTPVKARPPASGDIPGVAAATSAGTGPARSRNFGTVVLLAGLFALPLAISFWLYYGLRWHPAGTTNHGELIVPPRLLPDLQAPPGPVTSGTAVSVATPETPAARAAPTTAAPPGTPAARATPSEPGAARGALLEHLFRDKWTLVYVGDGACDDACRQTLFFMRQTRLSLNQDMTRVRRVFLATGGAPDLDYLGREHPGLVIFPAAGPQAGVLAQFPARDRPYSLYVVDPLGNLMMRYDARRSPKGLLEDLKKLLQLSHIG